MPELVGVALDVDGADAARRLGRRRQGDCLYQAATVVVVEEQAARQPDQCENSTGIGASASNERVTPPSICSRKREWL